jgi:hypothetical protein
MSSWSGSTRRRPATPLPAAVAAAALLAGALGGCTSTHTAASTESPSTLLQQVAGALDATTTFRLTLDTRIPKSTVAATAPASPKPGPSTAPQTEAVKMSGVWDVATGLARMDGTINSVKTTILSAAGVEYVSLTPDVAAAEGRKWLKADDSDATFGDFCEPGLVAQLLRADHEVHTVAAGHLAGTVDTTEADQHIADPNLLASLAALPDELRFDVWTDGSGAPSAVQFTLAGTGAVTTGTARLDSFGTAPAQVSVPTIDQVVQAPGS